MSLRGSEVWHFDGDPTPLARDNTLLPAREVGWGLQQILPAHGREPSNKLISTSAKNHIDLYSFQYVYKEKSWTKLDKAGP